MSRRVSPTERVRAQIDELFAEGRDLGEILEDVCRLSVRLVMQIALEVEVTEWLGRPRYSHGDRGREGHRNGYQPVTVKTTAGPVTLERPKLRGTDERFVSKLFGTGLTRTNALELLVISCWVRGLSDRDVEACLGEALGPEAALSKSTVSRICERLKTEFDAWKRRCMDDVELDYLFLDGSHFKMHDGAEAEPVLAAWGIDTAGKPVFVGLDAASSESTDAWSDFLTDLGDRGLRPPLLVISDGAQGLINGIETHFRASLRQRCLVHKARNVLAKVPKGDQGEVKKEFWVIFAPTGLPPGDASIRVVDQRATAFATTYQKRFPGAVECLQRDWASSTAYLRFPLEHHHRIRHSNFIERTFGETRRRVKVIGRLPGERSCLSLVWAVLDRASGGWRGLTMTSAGLRLLQDLRRQLQHAHTTDTRKETVPTAA